MSTDGYSVRLDAELFLLIKESVAMGMHAMQMLDDGLLEDAYSRKTVEKLARERLVQDEVFDAQVSLVSNWINAVLRARAIEEMYGPKLEEIARRMASQPHKDCRQAEEKRKDLLLRITFSMPVSAWEKFLQECSNLNRFPVEHEVRNALIEYYRNEDRKAVEKAMRND